MCVAMLLVDPFSSSNTHKICSYPNMQGHLCPNRIATYRIELDYTLRIKDGCCKFHPEIEILRFIETSSETTAYIHPRLKRDRGYQQLKMPSPLFLINHDFTITPEPSFSLRTSIQSLVLLFSPSPDLSLSTPSE